MIETPPLVSTCPACETRRLAAFRYCRSCGFDYEPPIDPLADPIVVPAPPPGMLATGTIPAPGALEGRRTEANRPWLRG